MLKDKPIHLKHRAGSRLATASKGGRRPRRLETEPIELTTQPSHGTAYHTG